MFYLPRFGLRDPCTGYFSCSFASINGLLPLHHHRKVQSSWLPAHASLHAPPSYVAPICIKIAQHQQLQKIINRDKKTGLKDVDTYIIFHLILHIYAEAFLFLSADLVLVLHLAMVIINLVEEI